MWKILTWTWIQLISHGVLDQTRRNLQDGQSWSRCVIKSMHTWRDFLLFFLSLFWSEPCLTLLILELTCKLWLCSWPGKTSKLLCKKNDDKSTGKGYSVLMDCTVESRAVTYTKTQVSCLIAYTIHNTHRHHRKKFDAIIIAALSKLNSLFAHKWLVSDNAE